MLLCTESSSYYSKLYHYVIVAHPVFAVADSDIAESCKHSNRKPKLKTDREIEDDDKTESRYTFLERSLSSCSLTEDFPTPIKRDNRPFRQNSEEVMALDSNKDNKKHIDHSDVCKLPSQNIDNKIILLQKKR